MKIIYNISNEPSLTFCDLDNGDLFCFAGNKERFYIKTENDTCFDIKANLLEKDGVLFSVNNKVIRVKGHLVIDEVEY